MSEFFLILHSAIKIFLHTDETVSVSESRTSISGYKSSSHSTNEDGLECREGQLDPLRFRTMFLQVPLALLSMNTYRDYNSAAVFMSCDFPNRLLKSSV